MTTDESKQRVLDVAARLAAAYVQGVSSRNSPCFGGDTMKNLAPMFVDWAIQLTNEVSARFP